MEIARNLRKGEKRKLKESGERIGGVESKTLETLYTRQGKRPRVNTNLETYIEELPLSSQNSGPKSGDYKNPLLPFPRLKEPQP